MIRRIVYRVEAFADVAEAFSWYEAQRKGLGWEFDAALHDTPMLLKPMPESAPVVDRGLRRVLMSR